MRERFSNILMGFIWIFIALAIICKVFGFWDFELFFDGWWTLFIIIPSVMSIIKYGFGIFSSIGLYMGLLILLASQNVIKESMAVKIIFPGILIIIGLDIIFKNLFTGKRRLNDRIRQLPKKEYAAVFSGNRINYPPEEFYGAEMNAVFGGLCVDLRSAAINEDVVIDVSAVFGGITIYLPESVSVKKSALCIFGGVSDSKRRTGGNGPKIYIEGKALFGGVKIL